jgi:hypothetical protein
MACHVHGLCIEWQRHWLVSLIGVITGDVAALEKYSDLPIDFADATRWSHQPKVKHRRRFLLSIATFAIYKIHGRKVSASFHSIRHL